MRVGEKYKCIKTVVMDDDSIAYIKGTIYPCEQDGCLTNESGEIGHDWNVPYWNNYFTLQISETDCLDNKLDIMSKSEIIASGIVMPDIDVLLTDIHSLVRDMGGIGVYMEYSSDGTGGVYYATSGTPLFYFSDKAEFISEANQWLCGNRYSGEISAHGMIFGSQEVIGQMHHQGFDKAKLRDDLEHEGFTVFYMENEHPSWQIICKAQK